MLAVVKPGDVVVAAKMDRMFRSASNALQVIEDFKKRRISLWRLDLCDDCSGRRADRHHPGRRGAQFERDLISERIKDAPGRHPAGSDRAPQNVMDLPLTDEQAELLRAARRARRRRGRDPPAAALPGQPDRTQGRAAMGCVNQHLVGRSRGRRTSLDCAELRRAAAPLPASAAGRRP